MMKYIKKIFLLLVVLFICLFISASTKVKAFLPLDYIEYYSIKIDPREDGTLDMKFDIKWKVLDSETEGPLKWVKIGIPNCYVDEVTALTDNIKKIKYYADGGSYIRVDFNKRYYEGEIVDFSFSIHQTRMYMLRGNGCYYHYVPGWFDEIPVEKAVVMWNSENVLSHNAEKTENGYLIWENKLDYGETIKIEIQYKKTAFVNLSEELQYTSSYLTVNQKLGIAAIICSFVVIIITIFIVARVKSDPYIYERGFYGRGYYHWYGYGPRRYYSSRFNSKGGRIVNGSTSGYRGGSGSGSFSCACACACAGGGRAGCSKKDFYNSNIKLKDVVNKLNK